MIKIHMFTRICCEQLHARKEDNPGEIDKVLETYYVGGFNAAPGPPQMKKKTTKT